jgi:hypothetical protein
MMFELTVMAGGERRWILVEEVVGAAVIAIAAVVVAANTAYLPSLHAGEVSSKRGNGNFERGGERRGRNRGAVSAGGDEILPSPFSPACRSSRHLYGLSRSCGGWPLLAHGSQRVALGYPRACVEDAVTCVRAIFWMQPRNPINGLLAPQWSNYSQATNHAHRDHHACSLSW